jgi:hypothetical protein
MTAAEKYISASCSIGGNKVYLNRELIFEAAGLAIDDFLLAIYQHFHFNYPKFHKMDNLSKLGWLTAELLLKNFDRSNYHSEEIGTVLMNANSSLDTDIKHAGSMQDVASPSVFVYTLPNIVAGEICIRHQFKGENAFFVQPVFNADFLNKQAGYLLDNDILQCCVCGWIDVLGQQYQADLFLVEKVKKKMQKRLQ